jgi:negative regulator of sigma E activity
MDNEERDSQLSAMFDGELSPAECDLLARRLGRDTGLRGKWARYALCGAVIRGERVAVVGANFSDRISVRLATESAHGSDASDPGEHAASTAAVPPWRSSWWRPLGAVAVAASVAVAAILLLRAQTDPIPGGRLIAAAPVPAAPVPAAPAARASAASRGNGAIITASNGEAESYVVPVPARGLASAVPTAQIANYVVAHSEFSSPLGRRALLSALMAGEAAAADAGGGMEARPPSGRAASLGDSTGATDAAR